MKLSTRGVKRLLVKPAMTQSQQRHCGYRPAISHVKTAMTMKWGVKRIAISMFIASRCQKCMKKGLLGRNFVFKNRRASFSRNNRHAIQYTVRWFRGGVVEINSSFLVLQNLKLKKTTEMHKQPTFRTPAIHSDIYLPLF